MQFPRTVNGVVEMSTRLDNLPKSRLLLNSAVLIEFILIFLWAGACKKKEPEPAEPPAQRKEQRPPEPAQKNVLRSALAGSWYPADANALSQQIQDFFEKSDVRPKDDVVALILPHAGYQYSGRAAASGLCAVRGQYRRIVVIGPSHRVSMEEILSVPRVTHYETPLGQTPLDVEFINRLLKHSVFQNVPTTHQYEHSVQIELPLLQCCQKDFKLVPIVAGRCSPDTIAKVGSILKSMIDPNTLVVVSSDFVHYGPNYHYVPFKEDVAQGIKKLDMGAYEHIAKLNGEKFLQYIDETGATICGHVPIAILLSMLKADTKAELITYATSGALTGDFTNSVSYLSIAFCGKWQNCPPVEPQGDALDLTEQDKKQLLALARRTIDYVLKKRRVPEPAELDVTVTDAMRFPQGAFVTLKKNAHLRGCIGDIFPQRPLYKSVIMNAIRASLNDKRFQPVTQDECDDITIEISVLTVPKPVSSPDEIRIGTDGVVLSKEGRSAVYLPQVAPEQGWNLEQTLTHLSQKAGLPPDAWRDDASFLVFQAVVFGEQE